MSRAATFYRSVVRRWVRAYRLVCARDDAATHGVNVPGGIWACGGCDTVLLGSGAPRDHLCAGDATF